jgi:hypothetical protein
MTTQKRLTTLYLDTKLRDVIKQVAALNNRSMNAQITHILQNDPQVAKASNEQGAN